MGKIYKVKWTLIAAEEYEYSVDWLLKHWNENITIQFVDAVENKIALLKKIPLLGNPSSTIPAVEKPWFYLIIYYCTKQKMKQLK